MTGDPPGVPRRVADRGKQTRPLPLPAGRGPQPLPGMAVPGRQTQSGAGRGGGGSCSAAHTEHGAGDKTVDGQERATEATVAGWAWSSSRPLDAAPLTGRPDVTPPRCCRPLANSIKPSCVPGTLRGATKEQE